MVFIRFCLFNSKLRLLHKALLEDGYIVPGMTQRGYWSFFRTLAR